LLQLFLMKRGARALEVFGAFRSAHEHSMIDIKVLQFIQVPLRTGAVL
jgi:hypothetical protein